MMLFEKSGSNFRFQYRAAVVIAGLSITLSLSSCLGDNQTSTGVIARVGSEELTREMILPLIPREIDKENREFFVKQLVETWIDNQVMATQAKTDGLELPVTDRWQLKRLEDEFLAAEYIKNQLNDSPVIPEEAILQYYEKNQSLFTRNREEVHLQHLFFEKLDNAIVDDIKQTGSLAKVVEQNDYLGKANGRMIEPNGDLGYLPVEELRAEFKKALRNGKPGKIFGPIRTGDGYHYLEIVDLQDAGTIRSLDLLRDEITMQLQMRQRQQQIRQLKNNLRKNYQVETFYDNIL